MEELSKLSEVQCNPVRLHGVGRGGGADDRGSEERPARGDSRREVVAAVAVLPPARRRRRGSVGQATPVEVLRVLDLLELLADHGVLAVLVGRDEDLCALARARVQLAPALEAAAVDTVLVIAPRPAAAAAGPTNSPDGIGVGAPVLERRPPPL
jgi:hypothetical protein